MDKRTFLWFVKSTGWTATEKRALHAIKQRQNWFICQIWSVTVSIINVIQSPKTIRIVWIFLMSMKTIVTRNTRQIYARLYADIPHLFIHLINNRYVCINYRKIKIQSPIMHICMHAVYSGKTVNDWRGREEEEDKRWKKVMAYSAVLMCIIVKKIVCIRMCVPESVFRVRYSLVRSLHFLFSYYILSFF